MTSEWQYWSASSHSLFLADVKLPSFMKSLRRASEHIIFRDFFAASFYHCPPIPFVWSSPALFVFLSLSHLFFPSEYALHSSEMSLSCFGPQSELFWRLCKWQCLAFQMSHHHSREWISGDLHFVLSQDAKVDLIASLLSAAKHSAAEFVTSEDSLRCSGLEASVMSLICSLTWHILQRGQKSFWLAWFYSPHSKVPWLFTAHPQVSRRRSKGLASQALNSDNLIGILLIRAALPLVSGLGATTVCLEPWESYSWTKHGPGHQDRPSVGRRSGGGSQGGVPGLIDFTLVTAKVRSLIICLALWKDSHV